VGGLSGLMGWTEAQREASRTEGFGGGALNLIKFAAVILVLDLFWFGYEVRLLCTLCCVVPVAMSRSGTRLQLPPVADRP
jgi:hypothetical protein